MTIIAEENRPIYLWEHPFVVSRYELECYETPAQKEQYVKACFKNYVTRLNAAIEKQMAEPLDVLTHEQGVRRARERLDELDRDAIRKGRMPIARNPS